jgi:hypothetical protein
LPRSIDVSSTDLLRLQLAQPDGTVLTPEQYGLGVVGAMKDIKKYTAPGSTVYVFGL